MVFACYVKNVFKYFQTLYFLVKGYVLFMLCLKKFHYFLYYHVFEFYNKTNKLRRYLLYFFQINIEYMYDSFQGASTYDKTCFLLINYTNNF